MSDLELALKISRDNNAPRALREKANRAIDAALQREIDSKPQPETPARRGFLGAILK